MDKLFFETLSLVSLTTEGAPVKTGNLSDSGEAIGAGATAFLGLCAPSEPESVSSIFRNTISEATAFGSVVHVGVIIEDTTTVLASTGFEVTAETGEVTVLGGVGLGGVVTWVLGCCMCMIGGLLGLVGLGRVKGSQKTTPLDDLLALGNAQGWPSTLSFDNSFERIELCDTPVECDLEMRADAVGVAVCKTGLPMTSFEGTKGNVEDFGREGFGFSSDGEVPPHGRVLVFDNKGIVCEVVGIDGVTDGNVDVVSGLLLLTFSSQPLLEPTKVSAFAGLASAVLVLAFGTSAVGLSSFLAIFNFSGLGLGGGGGPFLALTGDTSLAFASTLVSGFVLVSLDFTALKDATD